MGTTARAVPHTTSRAAVLDAVRAAGTISRAGLVRATGFTGATISTVVRRLIDDGLVLETGRAESTGGKPRVLLRLDRNARYAVGVHLDPLGTTCVLTDLTGAVVSRMTSAGTGAEDAAAVVERTAHQIDVLVEGAGIDRDRVLGAGLVSATHGSPTREPVLRYWADYPIGAELRERTGLPVVLGNDATAAALGEYWSGAVGGSSAFAAVYMGTGVGAGLLLDGIPYSGSSGNAGEIGHVCVDVDGPPCWCGARGCVEAIAGPAAVVALARDDAALARAAGLAQGADGPPPSVAAGFAAVVRAARRGEPTARALLDRSARRLAVAVRGLANVMDLDLLVLTGASLSVAGPVYLPAIRRELDQAFFARGTHGVEVRMSTSAETAPAIGAATLVLQSQLVPLRGGPRWPDDLSEAVPAHA
ncbi:putative NBD/HSP70 family sugar kinase [Nocardiopsis sp. Huas11]|uniref:ROK family transcriptional regulator n=1 Tax=Nocardiopsis sp. Huas11 TaxID=2183912 RepID=UPI000EAC56E3|nr:ROK family transcriptional regulator [Nocardiopsis sp. Huas11]RKS06668.1 putative NBD/HSP70 family sugar kinase [Nocardiopsis sp. Huas11]